MSLVCGDFGTTLGEIGLHARVGSMNRLPSGVG